MTELQYAARGLSVIPGAPLGGVPGHILGMTSCVRGCVRKAHLDSHNAAVSHVSTTLAHWLQGASSSNPGHRASATAAQNYIDCVSQYIAWDAHAGHPFKAWQVKSTVLFSTGDIVDGMVRVVLERHDGRLIGRVVLWDTQALTPQTAEVIAAVAIAVLDSAYPSNMNHSIEVWHLRHGQQFVVTAPSARAAFKDAEALVAGI